jgi:hypothetical protein
VIGRRPFAPGGSQYSTAASAVPSSSEDRSSKGGIGTARSMGGGIACCIVMCHRLKQSRIATKRFGSQSPIQSFQTHSKTMEAEVPQQIRGGQQNNGRRCARRDATALTTWSHPVSFENLHLSGMWRPISAQLHLK